MTGKQTLVALAIWLAFVGVGMSQTDANKPHTDTSTQAQSAGKADAEAGQRVFTQNCSRCHAAPVSIPGSVTATVALHMRVRAGLSDKDYKRLLAFLNP